YINAEAEHLLGRPRSMLLTKNVWEEFPAIIGTETERQMRYVAAEHAARDFETHYAVSGRWHENRAYPTADGGVAVYFRDVTASKQAELALQAHLRELENLYSLSQAISKAINVEAVYEAALDALTHSLQTERASILLFDEGGVMRFVAWRALS